MCEKSRTFYEKLIARGRSIGGVSRAISTRPGHLLPARANEISRKCEENERAAPGARGTNTCSRRGDREKSVGAKISSMRSRKIGFPILIVKIN